MLARKTAGISNRYAAVDVSTSGNATPAGRKVIDAISPGGGGAGVAYWAHVGGFGFGVAVALVVRWSGIEERLSEQLGSPVLLAYFATW